MDCHKLARFDQVLCIHLNTWTSLGAKSLSFWSDQLVGLGLITMIVIAITRNENKTFYNGMF